jgi:hypothetical protein
MKSVELKYPIEFIVNNEKKEIKFLTPVARLKLKHLCLIPPSMASTADGKTKIDSGQMMKMLPELTPFLAAVFNTTESVINDIDVDDLEIVMGSLEDLMSNEIEKKN